MAREVCGAKSEASWEVNGEGRTSDCADGADGGVGQCPSLDGPLSFFAPTGGVCYHRPAVLWSEPAFEILTPWTYSSRTKTLRQMDRRATCFLPSGRAWIFPSAVGFLCGAGLTASLTKRSKAIAASLFTGPTVTFSVNTSIKLSMSSATPSPSWCAASINSCRKVGRRSSKIVCPSTGDSRRDVRSSFCTLTESSSSSNSNTISAESRMAVFVHTDEELPARR